VGFTRKKQFHQQNGIYPATTYAKKGLKQKNMRISKTAAEFSPGLPKNIREFIRQSGFFSSGAKLGTPAKPQVEPTHHKQNIIWLVVYLPLWKYEFVS